MTGFLNRTPNTRRFDLNAFAGATRTFAQFGRFLLTGIAVSLITMPLTQRLWTWDRFLYGGQDFESGALAVLLTLCLVLVLAQHCRLSVNLLLATRHMFSLVCHNCVSAETAANGSSCISHDEKVFSPVSGMFSLPIQI